MQKTCVVLLSGGLDSLLALKLMTMQGITAIALHSLNCFHGTQQPAGKKEALRLRAAELGAREIIFPDITDDVIALTKRPRHGYGKHLNACIDCRLRTLRAGIDAMAEAGADFVVTGEVVGQRPMSQRKDAITLANRMAANWGAGGRILRPLCARTLEKTLPEAEGWVNNDLLFDISGRGRERQMELAERLGLADYPSPAGGCLLTDPGFSRRLAVLAAFNPDWSANDIELLKVGRPFQIAPGSRIVVSRNEEENYRLRELSVPADRLYINAESPGAIALLRGERSGEAERMAAGLAVHYSKSRGAGRAEVKRWRIENGCDVEEESCGPARAANPDDARAAESLLAGPDCLKELRRRGRLARDA